MIIVLVMAALCLVVRLETWSRQRPDRHNALPLAGAILWFSFMAWVTLRLIG